MVKNKLVQHPVVTLDEVVVPRGAFRLTINKLSLKKGQIACIVGPNGSGKTTLLLALLGLLPHQGECRVLGRLYDGSEAETKAKIGFIPDDPELLFEELTAKEQWSVSASVLASLQHLDCSLLMQHAAELARSISFDPPPKLIREYSHGMRKKTQIVNALRGSPPAIVIDELRNGLDPIAIAQAEALIKKYRDNGAAVLTATHDLWWAERFADYIYILNDGKIVAEGMVKQLLLPGEHSLEEAFCRIIGVRL